MFIKMTRRISTINDTKIKFLKVQDKLYQITDISFYHMTITAVEIGVSVANSSDDEVWDIEEFKNYKIKLINNGGQAEIMDFSKWKRKNIG